MSDIDALRSGLTLEEKATLTAGGGIMSTAAVERAGIQAFNVTDGPSGVRGPSLPGAEGPTSSVIPCGSAVGATWNPLLAERLGALLGREARDRNCRALLAPTVNLHRFPLAGRNFECYSEDPLLSGQLAAAFVRGVQAAGVVATVKHFVGNEAEFERSSINSVIDDRTLRELYFLPFEIAIRDGGALGLMTAYNRVNGRWLTEQREYLTDIVRGEWGFEGLIMTDWFAVASTDSSLAAGLDLEMPGPGRSLGTAVAGAVTNGLVKESDLDAAVNRQLRTLGPFRGFGANTAPVDPPLPSAEDLALVQTAAEEATVLLSNNGVLPLRPDIRSLAIVGPNATMPCIVGGGSAQANPTSRRTPLQALRAGLAEDIQITHCRGCEAGVATTIGPTVLEAPNGFDVDVFRGPSFSGEAVHKQQLDQLQLHVLADDGAFPDGEWSLRASGTIVSTESGPFELRLIQLGNTRVSLDGIMVFDDSASPQSMTFSEVSGVTARETSIEISFEEGRSAEIVVELIQRSESIAGFRVDFRAVDGDALMQRAVDAASEADVAIVFVGSSRDWESEGMDRSSFQLPGRQDELIRALADANDNTVVVINAGAPVAMSWADDVAAVLQCWLGGQGMADALTSVLSGRAEPGGRLPMSIPYQLRHSPAYDNFPGENGELRYGEGLFMGYRGHESRGIAPRYSFGHGLSFTTFEVGQPSISRPTFQRGQPVTVSVTVTNTGTRFGSEVVQCYIEPLMARLARPVKELKGFAKVFLAPEQTEQIEIVLGDRAFAYWDPGQPDFEKISARLALAQAVFGAPEDRREPGWQIDSGEFLIHIGTSSTNISSSLPIRVLDIDGNKAADVSNPKHTNQHEERTTP